MRFKKTMIVIVIVFIVMVVGLWVVGFLYANDFYVTTTSIPKNIKKVLIIFPHADDEVLTAGGLLSQLRNQNIEVKWVILTKGEKGNPNATIDENLKQIRETESQNAAKRYGISELTQKNYPDGAVEDHKAKLNQELRVSIKDFHPDLILTYDLAGLYGHPDHIVVSEVVTDLVKKEFPDITLWYASFPKRLLEMVPLPEQMAKDPNFKDKRSYPTRKVWVGVKGILTKIKAVYEYKSQRQSYINIFPIKQIPLWFYILMTPFEYFHEVR